MKTEKLKKAFMLHETESASEAALNLLIIELTDHVIKLENTIKFMENKLSIDYRLALTLTAKEKNNVDK